MNVLWLWYVKTKNHDNSACYTDTYNEGKDPVSPELYFLRVYLLRYKVFQTN